MPSRAPLPRDVPIELGPQNSYVRRLQHQLVEAYGLESESVGAQPFPACHNPANPRDGWQRGRAVFAPNRQDFA